MKALIYTRVSDDQRDGRSPREQEHECRAECDRRGWTVTEVLTDSAGASEHSRKARPGWERAKELIGAEAADILVLWEASRGERRPAGLEALIELCRNHGVLISYKGRVFDPGDVDDKFMLRLDGIMAAKEADDTSRRVQRATRHGAAQGRPHGRLLYGYERRYEKVGRKPEMVAQYPHPETGPVVARIFAEYLSGKGSRTIATELNADGIPGPKSPRWDDLSVRRVLRNPAYAGRRVHNGVMSDTTWEGWTPVVSGDTYDKAQNRLDRQAERQVRQSAQAHLLAGVAVCGKCGSKMRVVSKTNPARKLYSCRERHCAARSLDKLDLYVAGKVLERLSRPDVAEALRDEPDPTVEAARATVERARSELAEAYRLWQAEELSVTAYSKMEHELQGRIDAAERAIRQAVVPIELDVPADAVDEWWDSLDLERQREVIAALVAVVAVAPLEPGMDPRRWHPGLVRIEWR